MNDQTMNRRAFPELTSLHLPPQAAPIDRTESPATLAGTPGIEAAANWISRIKRLGCGVVCGC
jgi:hypothetical protein